MFIRAGPDRLGADAAYWRLNRDHRLDGDLVHCRRGVRPQVTSLGIIALAIQGYRKSLDLFIPAFETLLVAHHFPSERTEIRLVGKPGRRAALFRRTDLQRWPDIFSN